MAITLLGAWDLLLNFGNGTDMLSEGRHIVVVPPERQMESARQVQKSIEALAMLRRTSHYAGFRTAIGWLAALGYLALGLYAGVVLGFQDFAFGIMAVLECLASAAALHVTVQVILILVDIADAQIAGLEESPQ